MLLKTLPVALVAALFTVSSAQAQARQPAEMPPAGFAGQQYVDSRGCLFVRAGHGGQVRWVARIDRTRKPICGMTPSNQTMARAQRELNAPAPVVAAPAAAPVAAAPRPAAQPRPQAVAPAAPPVAVAPARVPTYQGAPGTNPVLGASRTAGCPAHAPYGKIYERAGAPGTILVCGSQPPNFTGVHPDRHGNLGHTTGGQQVAQAWVDPNTRINYAPQFADQAITVQPPKGYKQAWTDDRLNPNRARGTVAGHQQMQQVWTTDEVPQRGVNEPRKRRWWESAAAQPQAPKQQAQVTYATKAAPKAVAGARLVQVGSFGVPENASRAAQRLQSLGLPVQIGRATIKGKPVQVVSAGPFASPEQANAALAAVRRAGFGDAILRR